MDVKAKEKIRAKFKEEDRKRPPATPPQKQTVAPEPKKTKVGLASSMISGFNNSM